MAERRGLEPPLPTKRELGRGEPLYFETKSIGSTQKWFIRIIIVIAF